MILSVDDFKRIIEKPKNQDELTNAHFDNQRMSFHASRATSFNDISGYFDYYKKNVNEILIPDKQKPFWSLWSYPLPTTAIISDAADELNKVFEAKDKVTELKCKDAELTNDFEEYEDDNVCEFFEYTVFNAVLSKINSWVVVEMPSEQNGTLPEPKPFLIEACNLHDIDVYRESVEYIAIKKADDLYIFIDDKAYYQVRWYDGLAIVENQANHDLGYCPVFPIWHDNLNEKGIRKISPITDILDKLDDFVFNYTQKKFLDLYADSPILEKYATTCGNDDCQNGYIISNDGEKKACPTCSSNRKFIGAGSVVTKPMPNGVTGNVDKAANWISVPVDSLNYTKDKLDVAKKELYEFLTGYVKGQDRTQAVNQDQVYSQLEARKAKLNWWAENLSKSHSRVSEAVGKLRYMSQFVGVHVVYGKEFHLWTLKDALSEYEMAKKNGLPMHLLSTLRGTIKELVSGNSHYKEQRIAILQQLEPYPDIDLGLVARDTVEYELKANFSKYISDFERANGDIVQFGSLIDLDKKIQIIQDVLYLAASTKLDQQFQSKTKYQIVTPILN